MMFPKYSIIIPHYNSPTLLERCLNTIPERDDIQVLVVDDHSDSQIVDFAHFPGIERLNVTHIFCDRNAGAGRARNIGLEKAIGTWLLFADTDDFFTKQAWNIFDQHSEDKEDIIFYDIESRDSDTLEYANRCSFISDLVRHYQHSPSTESETDLRLKHVVPWGKMIRRELVKQHNIRFDEVRYSNDVIFSVQVGIAASHIRVVPTICYCVTNREGNLTSVISKTALLTRVEVIMRRNKLFRETHHAEYQTPLAYYLRTACHFGITTIMEVLRLAIKYRANLFIGMTHWHQSFINIILHKQKDIAPWQK